MAWSEDDKRRAMTRAAETSIRQAARELGIPHGTIGRWLAEAAGEAKRSEPAKRPTSPKRSPSKRGTSDEAAAEMPKLEPWAADLLPRQAQFVREYLVDLNATQAAIRAGYSEETAAEIAYENLRKPHLRDAVNSALAERARRTQVTADRVLGEVARVAMSDLRQVIEWGPGGAKLRPAVELTPDVAAAVSEVHVEEHWEGGGKDEEPVRVVKTKVKLHDKLGALNLLAKHLRLTTDRVEHTGADGGPIVYRADLSKLSEEALAQLETILASGTPA